MNVRIAQAIIHSLSSSSAMSSDSVVPSRRQIVSGGLCAGVAALVTEPLTARADALTERQIIEGLLGKGGGTRSLAPAVSPVPQTAAASPEDAARLRTLLEKLENARTRGFSVKRRAEDEKLREEIASAVSDRPAVDMEVYFDFNDWAVKPAAAAVLDKLGAALASRELASRGFLLEGHTDARGKREVNQTISQLRAQAVRTYLVSRHRINQGLLRSIGFGEERLKLPAKPNADENRRVRVVNLPDGVLAAR